MKQPDSKSGRSHMLYRNKENPFMIANVDRLIVGQDAGLECKTASAYKAVINGRMDRFLLIT